jgi:hypothetical protein
MDNSAEPEGHPAMSNARARSQALPRRRSESRQRTALVAIRLLPHERDMLAGKASMARGLAPRIPAGRERLRELRPRSGRSARPTLYWQVGKYSW